MVVTLAVVKPVPNVKLVSTEQLANILLAFVSAADENPFSPLIVASFVQSENI